MKQILAIFIFLAAIVSGGTSFCQQLDEYPLSRPIQQLNLPPGTWSGARFFSNVYCLKFPEPQKAFETVEIYYKNNAINLFRVTYEGRLMINIVASTLPQGRTAQEEIERLYSLEEFAETVYNHNYNITKDDGVFGPVIGIRIKNVAPAGSNAIFPLVRALYKKRGQPLRSMSAHRLFVRGPDRFEIAVFQMAPTKIGGDTEKLMIEKVTELADKTLSSFERCTSMLPVRTATY